MTPCLATNRVEYSILAAVLDFTPTGLRVFRHHCVGIDFSPSSIRHARERAAARNLSSQYLHEEIRTAEYGTGHHLVMQLFGEFNVFRHEEIVDMLARAYHALVRRGTLLLEPHTFHAVRAMEKGTAVWSSADYGLFSLKPH